MADTRQVLEHIKEKMPEAQLTPRFKNVVVSKNKVHVMVSTLGATATVKSHTPLIWYVPGLILGAVADSLFNPGTLGKFALYSIGVIIGGVLYAILKKDDLEKLKKEVEQIVSSIQSKKTNH